MHFVLSLYMCLVTQTGPLHMRTHMHIHTHRGFFLEEMATTPPGLRLGPTTALTRENHTRHSPTGVITSEKPLWARIHLKSLQRVYLVNNSLTFFFFF